MELADAYYVAGGRFPARQASSFFFYSIHLGVEVAHGGAYAGELPQQIVVLLLGERGVGIEEAGD